MDIENLTFRHQVTITPSDTHFDPSYIMLNGGKGSVDVITEGGEAQTWNLDENEVLPIRVKAVVNSTGSDFTITRLYNDIV